MNKNYYMAMNKKNYLALILTLIGSVTIFFNIPLVSVLFLVVIVTLFDGPLNKDLFIVQGDRVYFMNGSEHVSFRFISFVLLFVGFALCLAKYYMPSLCIFYALLLFIFLFNIMLTKYNIKFVSSMDDLVFEEVPNYTTYEILEVIDNNSNLIFKTFDKFKRENYILEYKVGHGFINYKELLGILKSKIKEDNEENK